MLIGVTRSLFLVRGNLFPLPYYWFAFVLKSILLVRFSREKHITGSLLSWKAYYWFALVLKSIFIRGIGTWDPQVLWGVLLEEIELLRQLLSISRFGWNILGFNLTFFPLRVHWIRYLIFLLSFWLLNLEDNCFWVGIFIVELLLAVSWRNNRGVWIL